jgi:hypothetical protein
MAQRLFALAVFIAAICFGPMVAEAKVPIPIPCTSDKIVKVADLPKTDVFALPGGQQIGLAWLYEGCFSGKWVGHVGVSDRYVTWKDDMLAEVAAMSGMKALPSAPGLFWGMRNAPGQFWVEWMSIVLLAIVAVSKLLGAKAAPTAVDQQPSAPAADVAAPALPAYDAALTAAIAARAKVGDARTGEARPRALSREVSGVTSAPPRRPARLTAAGAARALPKVAAPAFGRRA